MVPQSPDQIVESSAIKGAKSRLLYQNGAPFLTKSMQVYDSFVKYVSYYKCLYTQQKNNTNKKKQIPKDILARFAMLSQCDYTI